MPSIDRASKALQWIDKIEQIKGVEEWKEAFEEMDVDKSGKLTVDELYKGLKNSGCELTRDRVLKIIQSADDDGDQSLTFKEFQTLMRL